MRRVIGLAGVAAAAFLVACGGDDGPERHEVTYRVSKPPLSAAATVTYRDGGGTRQITMTSSSWSQTITAEDGDFLYVSVQNPGSSGSVSTLITGIKNSVLGTSTAPYGIATSSARCC